MKHPLATLLALVAISCGQSEAAEPKSNIIVILADDLGYGDVGCYGATKIKTPNIDGLAKEGMRFTDAHSPASVCTPTRYGLLTGRYCWRTNLQKGVLGTDKPLLIEPGRMTLASLLKDHGYRTAAIGKWHLGYGSAKQVDWNRPLAPGPLEIGFDDHFAVPQNHNDFTRAFVENHDLVGRKKDEPFRVVKGRDFPEGLAQPRVDDQVDTVLAGKAVRFIEGNHKSPFFLYYTPVSAHTYVVPAERFRGTSGAALYGDYVQELDAHVGEILDTLDRLKLTERTLVVLSSDNGGALKDFGKAGWPLNLASEAGDVRRKYRTAKHDAQELGHLTNGALREGKGTAYEGGLRVPFIVRWPGRTPAATVSDQTVCLTDLLATTASILGVKLPEGAGEDSFDVLPALTNPDLKEPIRQTTVLHGGNGVFAFRSGPWKLVEGTGRKPHELYNLADDPGETKNLAAEQPDRVAKLAAALAKARSDSRTRP